MVRDNVISFEQGPAAMRRRAGDSKMNETVSACRQRLVDTLPQLMQELFEHVDDSLYELADKAASDVVQTRYFDAMRELRKLRQQIGNDFQVRQSRLFDAFWQQPQRSETSSAVVDEEDLELVDADALEEDLAVNSMISKAENRYHRELFALNMRFAHLAGIPDLTTQQNPLGPGGLAENFRTALRPWTADLGVRLVVLKLFDRYVMGYIGGLYDDVNDILIGAGILPKVVQRVRRNPIAPSVQRARDERGGAQPTGLPGESMAVGAENPDQVLNMLSQALAMQRDANAARLYSGRLPGGVDAPRYTNLPAVDSRELLGALSELQGASAGASPVNAAQVQQLQTEMLVNLGRQLDMGSADAPSKRLRQVDQDVIDVIGMLFDFILDDSNVPDNMKALLGRLQIPMLKVAVLDRSFFANKQHPARRLLNTLARAAMGWVDDGDRSATSLYGRIDAAVGRILHDFNDDIALFSVVYDEFNHFVEREARGAEVAEERITQVTRGQEQLLIARRHVAEVLNNLRLAQPDMPTPVVDILREGWHDVMLLAYLREGADSEAWKNAREAVERLVWSVQPKTDVSERQRLLKGIPELLKTLRDGLNNISFDQRRSAELFKELQICHIAALRGEDDKLEADAGEEILIAEDEPREPVVESVEDAHLQHARVLPVGRWLEWQGSDNGWMRGKLSWRSEVTGNCIFVNRKGMKIAEMLVEEVAALFRDGRARELEDVDKPLMDRALDAMLGGLDSAGRDKPTS
jgi:hypothetical protein